MCGRASNAGVFVYWVACEYSCVCVGGGGAVLLTIDKCLNWGVSVGCVAGGGTEQNANAAILKVLKKVNAISKGVPEDQE